MTRTNNSFEGGTVGAGITTANSGGASGDAFDFVAPTSGSVPVYSTAQAAHGTKSGLFTPTNGATTYVQRGSSTNPLNSTNLAARASFWFTALTTDDTGFVFFQNAAGNRRASAHLDSTGRWYVRGLATTKLWTATNPIPTNAWVRPEMQATPGSTGSIRFAYYLGDSTTPVQSVDLGTVDNGTDTTFGAVGFGKQSNSVYASNFYIDDTAVETTAAGQFIGPYVAPAPGRWQIGSIAMG